MYNLEIAQDHTFTVGEGEWIVHNCAVPSDQTSSSGPSGGGFDPQGIQGSSLAEIQSRLPASARQVDFETDPNDPYGIQEGYKWQWQEGGYDYELYVHGPNPRAPVGSASYRGWIARVWR
jgi:Bacterial toxin 30